MSQSTRTPAFVCNLIQGDVFVGHHAHATGRVVRVEGAEGAHFKIRHRDTNLLRSILPSTLFGTYRKASPEEAARLFPWHGERAALHVEDDAGRTVHRRNGSKHTRGGTRSRLEPTTGSVSVEPAPPPVEAAAPVAAPAPAANDGPASMPGLVKVDVAVIEEIRRESRDQIAEMRLQFSETVRMITDLVKPILQAHAAAAPPPPAKTREEEREEATNKQVAEEMPWARPQLERFIDETMEIVTFQTASEIERALRPGEVFEQFSLWCEVNGLRVPFQKTVYRALLSDKRTSVRLKLSGKEEKTPLAIRRQTRFGFDESAPVGKDVQDVMVHARRTAWPSLAESYRETIARLLLSGKVTKADLFTVLDHIHAMPRRGDGYGPDMVLTERHVRSLVRIARAERPVK